jgi:isochorismate synthase
MSIRDSQAHLYMGCGITKDSNPRMEWRRNKTMIDEKKALQEDKKRLDKRG